MNDIALHPKSQKNAWVCFTLIWHLGQRIRDVQEGSDGLLHVGGTHLAYEPEVASSSVLVSEGDQFLLSLDTL